MYKIVHDLVDIKISVYLNFSNATCSRSNHGLKLLKPHCKKEVFESYFSQELLETGISSSLMCLVLRLLLDLRINGVH